jgi:hypothetical protein
MTIDPRCNSHSLTLERRSTSEGKQILFVSCETRGSEWRETWVLPNWFWLKKVPQVSKNSRSDIE